ncbi:MAG: hypothetical protein KF784_07320 [Fimbriimonadaceae bacterium]|nr:hypothetical protein [Fimbriimonadaceae bacterium]
MSTDEKQTAQTQPPREWDEVNDERLQAYHYDERRQRSMRIVLSSGIGAIFVSLVWLFMKLWVEEFFNAHGPVILIVSMIVLGVVSVIALAAFGERRSVDQLLAGALSFFVLTFVVWFFSISGIEYLALGLMIGLLPASLGVSIGHGIVCVLPKFSSRNGAAKKE